SRARTGDRADGELPLQDSNLDYLIQSRAVRVCLEDTMSVSGCPPSIGARRLGGQCPDWLGETPVKSLQGVRLRLSWPQVRRASAPPDSMRHSPNGLITRLALTTCRGVCGR